MNYERQDDSGLPVLPYKTVLLPYKTVLILLTKKMLSQPSCIPSDGKESSSSAVEEEKPVQSSSFVSSNCILPFVYIFSVIFVELLMVIRSTGMC